jgi:hypothetical protein
LAGGGPLGGIYEVARCWHSPIAAGMTSRISTSMSACRRRFRAAALANGISPAMYRLFIDDGADAALTPEIFLRPAVSESMLRGTPAASRRARREASTRATRSAAVF